MARCQLAGPPADGLCARSLAAHLRHPHSATTGATTHRGYPTTTARRHLIGRCTCGNDTSGHRPRRPPARRPRGLDLAEERGPALLAPGGDNDAGAAPAKRRAVAQPSTTRVCGGHGWQTSDRLYLAEDSMALLTATTNEDTMASAELLTA